MEQACALAGFIRLIKEENSNLNIICFTGYTLKNLLKNPPNEGVKLLLEEIDLLIDGPFIESKNNDIGLRGSSNQEFHYLTNRLINQGLEFIPRKVEIDLQNEMGFIVGIPTKTFSKAWEKAILKARKELNHEWS
jgi:anaerobic ribonucleoside-triphosphate reductase activating protein